MCGAVVVAAGCGGSQSTDGRTRVVAAFYPLAYAAEQIGGATVEVRNLTPPGAEPHDVELSPREVEAVRSADVVLYLGGGFQPAVEQAVAGASGTVVDVLPGLAVGDDPHVWLDRFRCGPGRGRSTPTFVPRSRAASGASSSRATPRSATSLAVTASSRSR